MSVSRAKNVIRYVVPCMLSSVSFFLFTVIDGIFVGRGIGTDALGAVNIVMPFVMVVSALSMLINIGGVTIFAIQIGRGNVAGANKVFCHGMGLLTVTLALLSAAGVFFSDSMCSVLGAGETFHELAADYMFWYSIFILPSGFSLGLQSYCRNDGAPGLVSIAVIFSTACNIFGDWLLIFRIPWGMTGAAVATGISQTISLFIVLPHFVKKQGILRFGVTKPDGRLLRDIVLRGLPEGINQLSTPVSTWCMNLVLAGMIGDVGVMAFSVISYVASFTVSVCVGAGEGLQPLFGQSYGAMKWQDLRFYFRTGIRINFFGSILVTGFVIAFSRPICALFGADEATLEYTLHVMPLYAVGFVVMSFNVMISSYLYSTESTLEAIVLNFLRSIVVNAAVILLLPKWFGVNAVWTAFAIYEGVVLIVAFILLRRTDKRRF